MPHGACWRWDWRLIVLHAPADLGTFAAYVIIAATGFYIYRTGHLRLLRAAYPRLWRLGAAFVLSCGFSHLGNFLEVWHGGALYWLTGVNKLFMATVSLWFATEFFRRREEIVLAGLVLENARAGLDDTVGR